ncbi:MAG: hypothetical protein SNJ75_12395 [Gemmataceae bacterium]
MRRGYELPLSLPRRLIGDYLHAARQVPTVTVERILDLRPLRDTRQLLLQRPGWCAVFTKAWAIVSHRRPELRRSFLSFPYERLYQHEQTTASIAVERDYQGEPAVFFLPLTRPEKRTLRELDHRINDFRTCALHARGHLRQHLAQARRPAWLRRWIYWLGLNTRGVWRDRYFGTFGVSSYAHLGAQSMGPLTVLTSTLSYGRVEKDGSCLTRVSYDHRVMDGGSIARALNELEETLNCDLLAELVDYAPRALDRVSESP